MNNNAALIEFSFAFKSNSLFPKSYCYFALACCVKAQKIYHYYICHNKNQIF